MLADLAGNYIMKTTLESRLEGMKAPCETGDDYHLKNQVVQGFLEDISTVALQSIRLVCQLCLPKCAAPLVEPMLSAASW